MGFPRRCSHKGGEYGDTCGAEPKKVYIVHLAKAVLSTLSLLFMSVLFAEVERADVLPHSRLLVRKAITAVESLEFGFGHYLPPRHSRRNRNAKPSVTLVQSAWIGRPPKPRLVLARPLHIPMARSDTPPHQFGAETVTSSRASAVIQLGRCGAIADVVHVANAHYDSYLFRSGHRSVTVVVSPQCSPISN